MPSRTLASSTLRASRVASTSASAAARPLGAYPLPMAGKKLTLAARRTLISANATLDTTPAPTALSALASRLSLPPNSALHPQLLACLTHPSYTTTTPTASNSLLTPLGNNLLGMFATEHLAQLYPLLPTSALQNAVSAHVGPAACFSIARELGVGVTGGQGGFSQGIPVRWIRKDRGEVAPESVPVAPGFRDNVSSVTRERREGFEDVVADTVRAFVGLVYQELVSHHVLPYYVARCIHLVRYEPCLLVANCIG
jgi:dsRNA-specific ribonuclease